MLGTIRFGIRDPPLSLFKTYTTGRGLLRDGLSLVACSTSIQCDEERQQSLALKNKTAATLPTPGSRSVFFFKYIFFLPILYTVDRARHILGSNVHLARHNRSTEQRRSRHFFFLLFSLFVLDHIEQVKKKGEILGNCYSIFLWFRVVVAKRNVTLREWWFLISERKEKKSRAWWFMTSRLLEHDNNLFLFLRRYWINVTSPSK